MIRAVEDRIQAVPRGGIDGIGGIVAVARVEGIVVTPILFIESRSSLWGESRKKQQQYDACQPVHGSRFTLPLYVLLHLFPSYSVARQCAYPRMPSHYTEHNEKSL